MRLNSNVKLHNKKSNSFSKPKDTETRNFVILYRNTVTLNGKKFLEIMAIDVFTATVSVLVDTNGAPSGLMSFQCDWAKLETETVISVPCKLIDKGINTYRVVGNYKTIGKTVFVRLDEKYNAFYNRSFLTDLNLVVNFIEQNRNDTAYFYVNFTETQIRKYHDKYQIKCAKKFIDINDEKINSKKINGLYYHGKTLISASACHGIKAIKLFGRLEKGGVTTVSGLTLEEIHIHDIQWLKKKCRTLEELDYRLKRVSTDVLELGNINVIEAFRESLKKRKISTNNSAVANQEEVDSDNNSNALICNANLGTLEPNLLVDVLSDMGFPIDVHDDGFAIDLRSIYDFSKQIIKASDYLKAKSDLEATMPNEQSSYYFQLLNRWEKEKDPYIRKINWILKQEHFGEENEDNVQNHKEDVSCDDENYDLPF